MKEFLCISIYLIFLIYGWRKEKFFLNPLTMFSAIWLVVVLCALTHPKLNYPRAETLSILIVGTLAFGIGSIVARNAKSHVVKFGKIRFTSDGNQFVLRYNLAVVLCCVCILAYIYNLVTLIRAVGSGNLGLIKSYLQTHSNGRTSWINAFYFLIVDPLTVSLPICAIADFVFGKKDKSLFIAAILLTLVKTIANTTRSTFGIIVVYFAIGSLMYIRIMGCDDSIRKFLRKKKRQIATACVIAAILFVWMTIARGSDVLDNLWTDFALPTSLFEYWRDIVDEENVYGYGLASLNGFIYPVFYFLKNIFGISIPSHMVTIHDLADATESFVWASNTVTANAYVSMFWYFYLDFRYVGIIIGSFLIGFFSEKKYRDTFRYGSSKNYAIFCFFVHMIIFSIVRMPFTIVSSALGFIYVIMVLYKKENHSKETSYEKSSIN